MNETRITSILWPEERIREELRRLDQKTGLHGAELPITYNRNHKCLASFYAGERKFAFSLCWFDNPDWAEEAARDIIRHEYAHYMNLERNGLKNHGPEWEACCREVGATPSPHYMSVDWFFKFYQLNGMPVRRKTVGKMPEGEDSSEDRSSSPRPSPDGVLRQ